MKKRLPILFMLAIVALQGSGVLHALHVAVEHAPQCYRYEGHAEYQPVLSAAAGGEGQGHFPSHQHDRANCPICHMLATLAAIGSIEDSSLNFILRPAFSIEISCDVEYSQNYLAVINSRAPPVC